MLVHLLVLLVELSTFLELLKFCLGGQRHWYVIEFIISRTVAGDPGDIIGEDKYGNSIAIALCGVTIVILNTGVWCNKLQTFT